MYLDQPHQFEHQPCPAIYWKHGFDGLGVGVGIAAEQGADQRRAHAGQHRIDFDTIGDGAIAAFECGEQASGGGLFSCCAGERREESLADEAARHRAACMAAHAVGEHREQRRCADRRARRVGPGRAREAGQRLVERRGMAGAVVLYP